MPVYASRLAVCSKMSGLAKRRNSILAFGMPLCRHSLTDGDRTSHRRAVAEVPPSRSMISDALGCFGSISSIGEIIAVPIFGVNKIMMYQPYLCYVRLALPFKERIDK